MQVISSAIEGSDSSAASVPKEVGLVPTLILTTSSSSGSAMSESAPSVWPEEMDETMDPDVRNWLWHLHIVNSLMMEQIDCIVELLALVATDGPVGLGPLLHSVESFAQLIEEEDEDKFGFPILRDTSLFQRSMVIRMGGRISWECSTCKQINNGVKCPCRDDDS
ncbi:hypothetical protein VNI00_016990 [Paramarasmius palmivorus]|uniref:Uncharacterized protein n=1 Tax=Paramarasmius palmivorus TaxID=297713 RepID=A0AAW0BAW0_9AGAR